MPLILPFPDDLQLSHQLVVTHGGEIGAIEWHRFPDQESLITIKGDCAERDVVIVCTLNNADAKTLPLYFAATTARELGARRIGLIAPYLAYMRQDHRFRAGQSLSAHSYAELLSTTFDWIATVDPHLHRIGTLEAIYSTPALAISAMPNVSEWIRTHIDDPVIIGPDQESSQWVQPVAASLNAPYVVLDKVRHGDRHVEVSALDASIVRDRQPVIIDDIASSGHTMLEVLKRLTSIGAQSATCVAVHALLSRQAEEGLRGAGAQRIVSTNTIPHATNEIDVNATIVAALGAWSEFAGRA
jgi:ribose-phosphate pyrophosphokinase